MPRRHWAVLVLGFGLLLACPASLPAAGEAPGAADSGAAESQPVLLGEDVPLWELTAAKAPLRGTETGLRLPRFVSLKSGTVNLRVGPGRQYPIAWVFRRRNLPVEVVAEFDTWRQIRDSEGTVGWVHHSLLQGARYGLVVEAGQVMRRDGSDSSHPVARIEPPALVRLERCSATWCRVEAANEQGWLPRSALWGLYPGELLE